MYTRRSSAGRRGSKELGDLHPCSHVHQQMGWSEIKRPHGCRRRPRNYINLTCRPVCPIQRNSFANISIVSCPPKALKCSIQDIEVKEEIQVENVCQELLIISDKEIRITDDWLKNIKTKSKHQINLSLRLWTIVIN